MQKRLIFDKIAPYFEHKNAIIITGLRQVGKTTLLRQIHDFLADKPKIWFDLDNPLDQKIWEGEDYAGIYKRLISQIGKTERLFIFLDEIQNIPSITKIVKYFIDHYNVKFFITGSSSFYLKNLFPESLSGRKFLYELSPLSFLEFLYFKGELTREKTNGDFESLCSNDQVEALKRVHLYEEYMQFGGFPEVVVSNNQETKKAVLKNIFASFFEKDLQILSDYQDIRQLRDFILLLVSRVGSMLDITKIAGELGVDRQKIYKYLDFLQGIFFIRLLPKFSRSIDREVAGGKKIYFCDTGILNTLGMVNSGQLLENTVVNQLTNYGQCSFYNKRNTSEIDVVLDRRIALEVKQSASEAVVLKLQKLAKELKLSKFFVVSQNYKNISGVISPTSF
ncbi:ATP-binding protein [Candidatus Amesbacteria bacterium]|nr:ATP-binding protein [Candidatus Amesbacteria bacterium]